MRRLHLDGTARFPFAFGWYGSDLPGYRACDSTYCFFPYEDLPSLDEPDETLDWLGPLDEATDRQMQVHRNRPTAPGRLQEIEAAAGRLGLILPAPFLRLMASPVLQDRIPSPTACCFELAKAIAPYPGSQDGFIIRFLNDQQNVLTWYLYLTREGASGVIVTPYWLEELTGVQGDEALGSTLKVTMGEGPDATSWEIKSGPRYSETADPPGDPAGGREHVRVRSVVRELPLPLLAGERPVVQAARREHPTAHRGGATLPCALPQERAPLGGAAGAPSRHPP
jgi:hypothetical protein